MAARPAKGPHPGAHRSLQFRRAGTTRLSVTGAPIGRVPPIEGVSMACTFADPKAASRHTTQYFQISANRASYADGWPARPSNALGAMPQTTLGGESLDGAGPHRVSWVRVGGRGATTNSKEGRGWFVE